MEENDDIGKVNLDPQKLFDEKKFKTLIVTKEGPQIPADKSDLTLVLTDETSSKEEKEEALKGLKELRKPGILIDAIADTSDPQKKAKLIAACWETGLEFNAHFLFFVDLVCSDDFLVSMESATVLEQITSINSDDKKKAQTKIGDKLKENPATSAILSDILDHLKSVS